MLRSATQPLVTTIRERCRVCYTCVRECPAKAIRIREWQAEVIPERCIGCGNCVRVCSQNAKQVASSTAEVAALLHGDEPVAAMLAPSFAADFAELDFTVLIGMLRRLGFAYVSEVAFGADLVATRYRELLAARPDNTFISTACPAVVGFIERYHPNLVEFLAPIVSPMVASARALRRLHGAGLRTVFIGPCIAKKGEEREFDAPEVDEVLTFRELRRMFAERGIVADAVEPSDFDPPLAGSGTLFPIARGLLQAAGIRENLLAGEVVAADGRAGFVEVIKEFESGDLDINARLLELLCCNGCIMGAGMSSEAPLFRRRARVSEFARRRRDVVDPDGWRRDVRAMADLDLARVYHPDDQRIENPSDDQLREIMARMGKHSVGDELNCGACGYDTCREHAVAIHRGLAQSEMCLPFTIEELRRTVKELALSHDQLQAAQQALMHSERLASMGQLAAGIAHEVNNPLGVVLLYAHMLLEEADRNSGLRGDLEMIANQADRCKKIVSGLLNFARQNKVLLQQTNLRDLVLQGLRSVPIPAGIAVRTDRVDPGVMAELDRDQMIQVLANLIANAVEAMPNGGSLDIAAGGDGDRVVIAVTDTGTGIAKEHLNKIFEPFFTTKPMGKGTGLGLPVIYGIVKMHRGDIRVESNADPATGPTGTTFTVTVPRLGERE
jgi:signal transduction histidine kinase/iron only hydrogenase large subunit-like protein